MIDIELHIRIQKSASLRIIISALEIIQTCLSIVIISPIAERIDVGNMVGVGDGVAGSVGDQRCHGAVAPGVVVIGGVQSPIVTVQSCLLYTSRCV